MPSAAALATVMNGPSSRYREDKAAPLIWKRRRSESMCLVSCDHIPRRSMALFRAKAVLDELIGGLPPRSSHRLQHIA